MALWQPGPFSPSYNLLLLLAQQPLVPRPPVSWSLHTSAFPRVSHPRNLLLFHCFFRTFPFVVLTFFPEGSFSSPRLTVCYSVCPFSPVHMCPSVHSCPSHELSRSVTCAPRAPCTSFVPLVVLGPPLGVARELCLPRLHTSTFAYALPFTFHHCILPAELCAVTLCTVSTSPLCWGAHTLSSSCSVSAPALSFVLIVLPSAYTHSRLLSQDRFLSLCVCDWQLRVKTGQVWRAASSG